MLALIVMKGAHRGRRIPVRMPEFLIGRDPMCHLRPSSTDVEAQHCAILTKEDGSFVRDDSTVTGTCINGRLLLGGEMRLEDGDTIGVGPLAFRVALAPGDEEGSAPREAKQAPRASGDTVTQRGASMGNTELRVAPPTPAYVPERMRDAREMLCP
jgi:predicted component of type VI protein secretion system